MRHKHIPALTPRAKELRRDMTPEERRLWYCFLRNYPVRFLRQKIIDGYIVDFYCAAAKLVVELDGSQHHSQDGLEYDSVRDRLLQSWGIETIRYPNHKIREDFEEACAEIAQLVKSRINSRDVNH